MQEIYIGNKYIYNPVADLAALKAIDTANVQSGVVVMKVDNTAFYQFDKDYSGAGDDVTVVIPTTGEGAWKICSPHLTGVEDVITDISYEVQPSDFAKCRVYQPIFGTGIVLPTQASSPLAAGFTASFVNRGIDTVTISLENTEDDILVGETVLAPNDLVYLVKLTAGENSVWLSKIISNVLPVSRGGTGATTQQNALENLGLYRGYEVLTPGGDETHIELNNPILSRYTVNIGEAGSYVKLPPMNESNSLLIGSVVVFDCDNAGEPFDLKDYDDNILVTLLPPNRLAILTLADNSTAGGSWDVAVVPKLQGVNILRDVELFGYLDGPIGQNEPNKAAFTDVLFNNSSISGYEPYIFNCYEQYVHATTFSWGSFTSSSTNVDITRTGNHVCIKVPTLDFTSSQTASISSGSNVPARFRPSADFVTTATVYLSGNSTCIVARCVIASSGQIFIQNNNGSTFPASTSILVNSFAFNFTV